MAPSTSHATTHSHSLAGSTPNFELSSDPLTINHNKNKNNTHSKSQFQSNRSPSTSDLPQDSRLKKKPSPINTNTNGNTSIVNMISPVQSTVQTNQSSSANKRRTLTGHGHGHGHAHGIGGVRDEEGRDLPVLSEYQALELIFIRSERVDLD